MKFTEMIVFNMHFQKIINRGTKVIRSKLTSTNWTSEEFKEYQNNRLPSIPSNFVIHIGRGIRTMKIEDLPKFKKSSNVANYILVTNRGTKIWNYNF